MTDKNEMPEVSKCCEGEVCSLCGKPAQRKVGEEILHDDPNPYRHNLTAYVCLDHFNRIMDRSGYLRADLVPSKDDLAKVREALKREVLEYCMDDGKDIKPRDDHDRAYIQGIKHAVGYLYNTGYRIVKDGGG